jgi:hypothetical protein
MVDPPRFQHPGPGIWCHRHLVLGSGNFRKLGMENPRFLFLTIHWIHLVPSGKLRVGPWQLLGLEDEFPLKIGEFQGLCLFTSGYYWIEKKLR